MYKIFYYKKAREKFRKLPRDYQHLIQKSVDRLTPNPFLLDIKKLDPGLDATHRLRVGDYRLFLEIDTTLKTVIIIDIRRRTSQTYS